MCQRHLPNFESCRLQIKAETQIFRTAEHELFRYFRFSLFHSAFLEAFMKRYIFSLISVSVLAASFAACSNSSSNGSTSGDGGPTSSGDACSQYAAANNAYTTKCSGGIDPAQSSANAARFTTLCDALEKLNGISPTFDSDIAACATAINAADCTTAIEQIPACGSGIPNGTLDTGAACASGLQCTSGGCSAGEQFADGGSSNCGTCQAPAADGADCSTAPCVTGDTCSLSIDGSGNLAETCTKQAAPAAVGGTCASDTDCVGPNHCNFATPDAQTGTCAAPGAAGASCSANQNCTTPLVCTGSSAEVCTTAVAAGGTCAASSDCAVGTACDTTSLKCIATTYGKPGATCDGTITLCSQGQCNVPQSSDPDAGTSTAGTCPTVIADGQACDPNDASQTCDDYAGCLNSVCALLPATCN
jgi:hypothetical protein